MGKPHNYYRDLTGSGNIVKRGQPRVRIRGAFYRRVVDTGPTLPKVDGELVAEALGVELAKR